MPCITKHHIFCLVFIVLGMAAVNPVYGQTSAQPKKITASYSNASLKTVLEDLEKKTDMQFSYSPNKIPLNENISVSFSDVPLQDALYELFAPLPVKFELLDDFIVLKKGPIISNADKESQEKKLTINGYIKDNKNGEYLIGATIYIKELGIGTISNNYGYFSITIPPGRYTLVVSYIGYEDHTRNISLAVNTKLDFKLNESPQKLEEVTISSFRREEMIFKLHASQSEILPDVVKKQPSLLGESDVIKTLEYQSGISFYGDGSSYFHVRGGNYDQNLIILDEATIFNPSHLLGIFSPIIPDAVKSVDIYKADFPVQYGGRLSSVVDIRTKDGNKNKFSASGSLGLISARGTVEGPLKKDASSFFVSFRRSYFDTYLKKVNENLEDLYFYDFTTKVNLRMGPKNRLFVTVYKGEDVFRTSENESVTGGLNWGNNSGTIRWNHIFGSRLFLNSTLFSSKYQYFLHNSVEEGTYWNSEINNTSLKEELTFYATPRMQFVYGFKLGVYNFNPGNYYTPDNEGNVQVSPVSSLEFVSYAGGEYDITDWLRVNYGLRITSWTNYGESFVVNYDENYNDTSVYYYDEGEKFYEHASLQPRLSLSLRTGKYSSLKAGYVRTNQYINLINNSISPFNSLEVWLPAGPNIKPQWADIVDAGYMVYMPGPKISFQTDVFYKWMYNQIGYEYHADMLVNPLVEGELRQGKGWSYGFEVSLNRDEGKISGQIAYTYMRSFLNIDALNGGRTYPAIQDKPHNLNLLLALQLRPRWQVSFNYTLASGMRISVPTSFYYYRGYQVPLYTEQNNSSMPLYSRLDFSTTIQLNKIGKKFNHFLNFSIYNMLGNENPIFVYFNKSVDNNDDYYIPADRMNPSDITPTMRYTFKFFPSITYQFNF
ncbi:MAG: TonB-dependent receptor [Bacteroidales bacterium]|nr:TonB-dependent receptor [Bacteroidales bacterium]